MAQNHIQKGDVISYINDTGSDILAGTPVVIGTLVGMALVDIPVGAQGSVAIEDVWELPKTSSAITQGAMVYLTPGKNITATATGNTLAGKAFAAAGSSDDTVLVKINA